MIDFKFMEALEAVVNEGGFEKASRVLHITQSAVSQRIKYLEEMSGQILLIRKTPPVPTRAGAKILKYFMQARQLEQELFEKLSPAAGKKFKPLPLGINADSLATWFLDAVLPFLRRESVTVDIRVDDQEQTLEMLRNGEVFGCISAHPDAIQGCRSHFLGSMTYRMLATPDFAQKWFSPSVSFKTIEEAPLLVFNKKDELQAKILKRAIKKTAGGYSHSLPPVIGKISGIYNCGHGLWDAAGYPE